MTSKGLTRVMTDGDGWRERERERGRERERRESMLSAPLGVDNDKV